MYKKLALVVCWVLMSCSVNSAAVPAPVDAQQQCVQKVQKFMDEALKAGLSQKEAEDLLADYIKEKAFNGQATISSHSKKQLAWFLVGMTAAVGAIVAGYYLYAWYGKWKNQPVASADKQHDETAKQQAEIARLTIELATIKDQLTIAQEKQNLDVIKGSLNQLLTICEKDPAQIVQGMERVVADDPAQFVKRICTIGKTMEVNPVLVRTYQEAAQTLGKNISQGIAGLNAGERENLATFCKQLDKDYSEFMAGAYKSFAQNNEQRQAAASAQSSSSGQIQH